MYYIYYKYNTYNHLLQVQPSIVLADLCQGPGVPEITNR